uniref:Toll-like receptor 8 n=1 Tax=Andrias davidianus TaxID=141262 RepID=V5QP52_ANDDA|nr:toll-like receptor 8 [Andrias davidianus]
MITTHNLMCLLLLIYGGSESLAVTHHNRKTLPCDVTTNGCLNHFDCSDRRLRAVPEPVERQTDATELNLSKNFINTISEKSFQGWGNLVKINLNNNHNSKKLDEDKCKQGMNISNEAFHSLRNLTELLSDGNYLCRIPVGIPSNLSKLSLQYNSIFSLNKESLSELKHLKNLFLGHNCYYGNACGGSVLADDSAFEEFTDLTILSLSFDNLTHVPLNLPASLKELYLSNNKITQINQHVFQNLSNLEILHLSGNCPRCYNADYPCEQCPGSTALQIHRDAFINLKHLKELSLSSTSLRQIEANWFKGTPQLKKLSLQHNYLVHEIATGDFLLNLPNLNVLDLSFNYDTQSYPKYLNISEHFSKLASLQELHIQGYVFEEVSDECLMPLANLTNLNILNLGVNFIKKINLTVFQRFSNVTLIYLSENRISPLSHSKLIETSGKSVLSHRIQHRSTLKDPKQSVNDIRTVSNNNNDMTHSTVVTGDGTHTQYPPLIKPHCSRYGKNLDLSLNSIFYIDPEQFEGLEDITCLNLSSNAIGQFLNGTEFIHLTNLRYLDVSYNKLDLGTSYAFSELHKLEVLDLSHNRHYFVVAGVTHDLGFIEQLPNLKVLNLSWNEIFTLTQNQLNSSSLKTLIFKGNRLDKLWTPGDTRYTQCFKYLSNLTYLDLSYNRLKDIPNNTFLSLPLTLKELYLNNNDLVFFSWKDLSQFEALNKLDLSSNKLTMLIYNVVNITHSLETLLLRHNHISHLADGFLDHANNLTHLDLSNNRLPVINESAFQNQYGLKVLVLKGNPFECTCETSDFMVWLSTNNLTIPRLATDVTCSTPADKMGDSVISFDLHTCNLDKAGLALFFLSFLVIMTTIIIAVLNHLFYWDAWYIYYFCWAKLKGYTSLDTSKCLYDAYISYDTKDSAVTDWVMKELYFHLEGHGDKDILLCLQDRDWEPGKAVIDNLTQSIHQSRKTIFVLTEQYVKSGNFKTAFYIALQRLMDESMDVIVLILLQQVLQHSQYLRLRKRICKSSILEWPKNPHAEGFFWQRLKNVVLTENHGRYNSLFTDPIIPQ